MEPGITPKENPGKPAGSPAAQTDAGAQPAMPAVRFLPAEIDYQGIGLDVASRLDLTYAAEVRAVATGTIINPTPPGVTATARAILSEPNFERRFVHQTKELLDELNAKWRTESRSRLDYNRQKWACYLEVLGYAVFHYVKNIPGASLDNPPLKTIREYNGQDPSHRFVSALTFTVEEAFNRAQFELNPPPRQKPSEPPVHSTLPRRRRRGFWGSI